MIFDPVLDVPHKKQVVENFTKDYFGDESYIQIIKGKDNIKYDFIIHNAFGKAAVKAELKTRWPSKTGRVYDDLAVEITQYKRECDKLDDYISMNLSGLEIFNRLESFSSGWFWKSKADIIIQITKNHIDVINKNKLRDWIYNNSMSLLMKRRYCSLTTGSYNIIVPYNSQTKQFINRTKNYDVSPIYGGKHAS